MQGHSKGVFALSFAFFGAGGAAGCTTDHLDLFDPSWRNDPPAQDAAPNPGTDAGSIDTGRPTPPGDALADAYDPAPQPDAASRESGPPPVDDAETMEPKDAGVTVPEDARGGMEVVDVRVVDVPVVDVGLDLGLPGFDAGGPVDTGVGFDCLGVHGIVFRGHCYFSIASTQWERGACASEGAHLATLTSAEEQLAVGALAPGQERWIGLRRRNNSPRTPTSFDWVTDEPLSYANWHEYNDNSREPNYTGECVRLLSDGTWADNDCSDRFPALCEHE